MNVIRSSTCIMLLVFFMGIMDGFSNDADTRRPGLVAHYYKDPIYWGGNWTATVPPRVPPEKWIFTTYSYSRVEPVVNHRFPLRSWFSVRWQGVITIAGKPGGAEGDIEFGLKTAHGARLIINGQSVVSVWDKFDGKETVSKGTVKLKPGTYPIELEAFFGKNLSQKKGLPLVLTWRSEALGIGEQVVPQLAFKHSVRNLTPKKEPEDVR